MSTSHPTGESPSSSRGPSSVSTWRPRTPRRRPRWPRPWPWQWGSAFGGPETRSNRSDQNQPRAGRNATAARRWIHAADSAHRARPSLRRRLRRRRPRRGLLVVGSRRREVAVDRRERPHDQGARRHQDHAGARREREGPAGGRPQAGPGHRRAGAGPGTARPAARRVRGHCPTRPVDHLVRGSRHLAEDRRHRLLDACRVGVPEQPQAVGEVQGGRHPRIETGPEQEPRHGDLRSHLPVRGVVVAMPPFLQSFVDGPKLPKVILGVLGLVVIVGGGWFLLLSPVQLEVTALEARRQQLATELALARSQVTELQAKLDSLKAKLPTEKETPALYRAVSEAAQGSGLGVSLFQPREPKPKDYVAEIPITITAEGGYHQLGLFFEKVAGLERVVKAGEMKLTGLVKGRSALRAELTLATYMYRDAPPAKPGAPAPAAPKPAAALPSKEART